MSLESSPVVGVPDRRRGIFSLGGKVKWPSLCPEFVDRMYPALRGYRTPDVVPDTVVRDWHSWDSKNMEPIKAPFPYFGGKSRVADLAWNALGPVDNYIEPFAGSLAVLLARSDEHEGCETVNDADSYLANFWRAISHAPDEVAKWCDWPVNECVPAGTMISTPTGPVPVESIRAGMVVYGFDAGAICETRVIGTKESETSAPLCSVAALHLTGNHPVWTPDGYVPAAEILPGAKIGLFPDWPVDKSDLRITISTYETMGNLQLDRPANREGAICRGDCSGPCQEIYRTPVSGTEEPAHTSGLLDQTPVVADAGAYADCDRNGHRRGLAGAGTTLDIGVSQDLQSGKSHRRWGRDSRVSRHSRTQAQVSGEDEGAQISAGPEKCDARETSYARGTRQDSACRNGPNSQRRDEGQYISSAQGEAIVGGTRGEVVSGEAREALARRTEAQNIRFHDKPKASGVRRNGRGFSINHGGGANHVRKRGVGVSGNQKGLPVSGETLQVFNFQTTTGNYFANRVLVHNCDLLARHLWLVDTGRKRIASMESDPDFYDAKVAGWWVWGINAWIGSGWCQGNGPWKVVDGEVVKTKDAGGQWRQLPHLGNEGQGVNRQRPHLGDEGRGVNRKRPHLGTEGRGETASVLPRDGALIEYFRQLADRLRRVRVCCGDWSRVVTNGAMSYGGTVGVFLDPPYLGDVRAKDLYRVDNHDIAHEVREWAIANGDDPRLRIVLAGYHEEHADKMPSTWRMHSYSASKAYGTTRAVGEKEGNDLNRHNERLWFSPHCLQPETQGVLFP